MPRRSQGVPLNASKRAIGSLVSISRVDSAMLSNGYGVQWPAALYHGD